MKFYTSIEDMPVYNWFKCIEKKEYNFVLLNPKDGKTEGLEEAFSFIYAEYVDTFGVSEPLQEIMGIQNEILCLKIDLATTNDNFFKTLIELKEIELLGKLNVKVAKTNTAKIAIEKYLGFPIKEKEVSVKEYYDYLEALKENGGSTD